MAKIFFWKKQFCEKILHEQPKGKQRGKKPKQQTRSEGTSYPKDIEGGQTNKERLKIQVKCLFALFATLLKALETIKGQKRSALIAEALVTMNGCVENRAWTFFLLINEIRRLAAGFQEVQCCWIPRHESCCPWGGKGGKDWAVNCEVTPLPSLVQVLISDCLPNPPG